MAIGFDPYQQYQEQQLRDRRDQRDMRQKQADYRQEQMDIRQKRRDAERGQVPGFNRQFDRYSNMERGFENRAENPQFRDYQGALLKQLQADANGNGPGQALVRMQAQQMADRGAGQQMAMAGAARPGQSAMAGRNAAFNAGNINSQVGGQAAQAGLQARLGAMSQMGQVAGQARQGDLAMLGLNDQSQLEALRQRLQLSGMQQGGQIDLMRFLESQRQFNKSQPADWERYVKMLTDGGAAAALAAAGG